MDSPTETHCSLTKLVYATLEGGRGRRIEADFSGGLLTSNGGALLDEPVRLERPAAVPQHLRDGAGQPAQGRAGGRRDAAGKGLSGHAAEPAPEDRGARAGQFEAGPCRAFQRLPGQAGVRAGLALALPPLTAEPGAGVAPARQRTRRRGVSVAPQSGTGRIRAKSDYRKAETGAPHTRIHVPGHPDHSLGAEIPLLSLSTKSV